MLKVTAPLPVGIHILAPALPRFRKRYPKLAVDLRLADRQTDLIAEGIDVALRVGNLADSRLLSRRLAPHRLCAFASPGYLERMGIPQSIEELSGHECVNFRYQSSGQSLCWPFQVAERMMEFTPNAGIVVDASDGVLAVLAAGGGIGISPTYAAACHVRRGELVPVLPQWARERYAVTALWPESRRASPNVRAFLDFLREIFPTPAPWDVSIDHAAGLA